MANELYYICSQCGKYTLRTSTKNNYIHPCTQCNSPKLIQVSVNIWQQKRMVRKGTWDDFVNETIAPFRGNPQYIGKPQKDYSAEIKERKMQEEVKEKAEIEKCTPKCPTCGCTKIKQVSIGDKMVGIALFWLFSNTRKYQFECLNPKCKYKW